MHLRNRFFNYEADAKRAFEVVASGGVAIIPGDLGYAVIGSIKSAMDLIHRTKRRVPEKLHGFTGNAKVEREIHDLDDKARNFVEAVTYDFDLPLGVVAPANLDHPLIRRVDPGLLPLATRDGTLNIVLNGGPLLEALAQLCDTYQTAIFGSSANISTKGVKARVTDIEPEITDIADLVIDHGVCRWYEGGRSSTIIDMRDYSVIRAGVSYGQIADIAFRFFAIRLPPDNSIVWPGT